MLRNILALFLFDLEGAVAPSFFYPPKLRYSFEGMECLEKQVGLAGVCSPSFDCLYINDIPSMSFKKIGQTADEETINAKKFFEKKRKEAALLVCEDILNCFPNYKFTEIIDEYVDGNFRIEDEFYEIEGIISKKVVKTCVDNYLLPEIDHIKIGVCEAATIELTIKHLKGQVVNTIELTPGINTIPICVQDHEIEVSFDATGLKLMKVYHGCDCMSACDRCNSNCCETISTSSFDGIVACVRCICSKEAICCKYAKQAKHMMRYMTAALILEERKYSTRKNPFLRNTKEEARDLYASIMGGEDMDGYTIKKEESKYYKALNRFQKNVGNVVNNGPCFVCTGFQIASHGYKNNRNGLLWKSK